MCNKVKHIWHNVRVKPFSQYIDFLIYVKIFPILFHYFVPLIATHFDRHELNKIAIIYYVVYIYIVTCICLFCNFTSRVK